MLPRLPKAWQPMHTAWSRDHLLHECAVALGHTLNNLTIQTYNSHLQLYLTFCKMHAFALEPTTNMLSFYVVYMAHHIKPNSVAQYFSGIINTLQLLFPNAHAARHHPLVTKSLTQMCRL